MALHTQNKPEYGLIILGNAGSGKSYICNLLLGKNRFESEFQAEAVTTRTEYERLDMGAWALRVYNIPGLVEADQQHIDRNRVEIMRAFAECPKSIVIFVWSQVGGRAQANDVIAFKALNDAYPFSRRSLAFVVNNLPRNRPPKYEGQFLTTLNSALSPLSISVKDTIFVDTMGPDETDAKEAVRQKLNHLVAEHQATVHRKEHDIILAADLLNEQREDLRRIQDEAERDRDAFQRRIEEMAAGYERERKESEQRQQERMREMQAALERAEEDRAAHKRHIAEQNVQNEALRQERREAEQRHEDRIREMQAVLDKAEQERAAHKRHIAEQNVQNEALRQEQREVEQRQEDRIREMQTNLKTAMEDREAYRRDMDERDARSEALRQEQEARHEEEIQRLQQMARLPAPKNILSCGGTACPRCGRCENDDCWDFRAGIGAVAGVAVAYLEVLHISQHQLALLFADSSVLTSVHASQRTSRKRHASIRMDKTFFSKNLH